MSHVKRGHKEASELIELPSKEVPQANGLPLILITFKYRQAFAEYFFMC